MIDLSNLSLNLSQLNGGSDEVKVIAVRDWVEYEDGKRGDKRLGSRYTCVLIHGRAYEKVNIKISEKKPTISQEELASADNGVSAIVTGFVGRLYTSNNGVDMSATATSIEPIDL